MNRLSTRRGERGSTLLMVMVSLMALLIIGLAAVEFTGRDAGSARVTQRKTSVERCALAARNWLLGQNMSSIAGGQQLVVNLNGSGGEDSVTLIEGQHYDGVVDAKPGMFPQSQGGIAKRAGNSTNKLFVGRDSNGGIYTALCKDGSGRSFEVEFAFALNIGT